MALVMLTQVMRYSVHIQFSHASFAVQPPVVGFLLVMASLKGPTGRVTGSHTEPAALQPTVGRAIQQHI